MGTKISHVRTPLWKESNLPGQRDKPTAIGRPCQLAGFSEQPSFSNMAGGGGGGGIVLTAAPF